MDFVAKSEIARDRDAVLAGVSPALYLIVGGAGIGDELPIGVVDLAGLRINAIATVGASRAGKGRDGGAGVDDDRLLLGWGAHPEIDIVCAVSLVECSRLDPWPA